MRFILFICIIPYCQLLLAQKSAIERVWFNQEKTSKIQVFLAKDGKYYGKIVWLKSPNDEQGKSRTDSENPDKAKQSNPLMGLLILTGFEKTDKPNEFTGGKVYDPNNGKTYCGKVTVRGNSLDLRGYICGLSWLGRTSEWTTAE